jgi:hypothetical protein
MVVAALAFVLFRSNTFVADLSKNDFSTTVFVVFSNLTMFFQDWFLFLEIDNGALRQRDGPSPVLPGLSCRFRLRGGWPLRSVLLKHKKECLCIRANSHVR